jgi:hypothetical protein
MKKLWKDGVFILLNILRNILSHVIVNCEFIFWELGGTFSLLIGLNFPYGVEPLCHKPLI